MLKKIICWIGFHRFFNKQGLLILNERIAIDQYDIDLSVKQRYVVCQCCKKEFKLGLPYKTKEEYWVSI